MTRYEKTCKQVHSEMDRLLKEYGGRAIPSLADFLSTDADAFGVAASDLVDYIERIFGTPIREEDRSRGISRLLRLLVSDIANRRGPFGYGEVLSEIGQRDQRLQALVPEGRNRLKEWILRPIACEIMKHDEVWSEVSARRHGISSLR